jgi:copper transport protein
MGARRLTCVTRARDAPDGRPSRHTAVLILFVAALLAAALPAEAGAHALFVRSEPADSTVLLRSPREVKLVFGEEISPEFSSVQVLDVRGKPVEDTATRVDSGADAVLVSLPDLRPGPYTVAWRVLSEDDAHATDGSIVFGVGAGTVLRPTEARAEPSTRPDEALVRWVGFCLLAGLIGGLSVARIVLPATKDRAHDERLRVVRLRVRRRAFRLATASAYLAFFLGFALLAIQVLSLRVGTAGGSLAEVAQRLLADTRWGALWISRETILGALVVTTTLLARSDANRDRMPRRADAPLGLLTVALVGALVAVQALAGHAAGLRRDMGLAVAADAVHLLAASVWVGGVAALLIGLVGTGSHDWRPILARFGRLAVICVGLVVATGLYSAGREVASASALGQSLYGRTLIAKSALVALVLLVGGLNAVMVRPKLMRPLGQALRRPEGWIPLSPSRLRSLVAAEAAIGVAVLLAAGLLGAAPPARTTSQGKAEPVATALTRSTGDLLVTLSVRPNRPGENVFAVQAASSRRPQPAEITGASLRFTSPRGEPPAGAALEPVDPGRFRLGGGYLVRPGSWRIAVTIRRAGLPDRVAGFDWTVGGSAIPSQGGVRPGTLERPLTIAAALVLAALLAALSWAALGRPAPPAPKRSASPRPPIQALERQP